MPSSEQPQRLEETSPSPNGNGLLRQARRVIFGVVGATVVFVGLALLILPGPGVVVLLLGLSILAAEFAWARRLLHRVKREGKRVLPERLRRFFERH